MLLGSCRQPQDASGGSTPEAALQATASALKTGNLKALLQRALPPQDYANLRADWPRLQQQWSPISKVEQAQWAQTLHQLTAPDASQALAARWLPKKAAMEQKYQDQWPIFVAIGAAWLKKNVNQGSDPNADQKARINRFIDALTPWAQQAAWFDPAKARQAIDVTVSTARSLDPGEPDAWRRMGFDAALSKASIAFTGAGKLLSIYRLSVDDVLASAKFTRINLHDNHATVRLSLDIHGQPFAADMPMLEQDGRWYSADLLDAVRRSHVQALQGTEVAATRD